MKYPSSRAMAKRPTLSPARLIIGVVVFAFGLLVGAGIAAWMVPPY
jgi:hypothetical protein